MRIAQIAPLFEAVPPRGYGGTERVVSWLTEALVELGHEVTLFASSDSETRARLLPAATRALRLENRAKDHLAHHYLQLQTVVKYAHEFDILHGHIDYLPFPIFRERRLPSVTTLHGRLDQPELFPLFKEFSEMPVISISNMQRAPMPHANWAATIYHGLPSKMFEPQAKPTRDYVLFLGRICPEKGVDQAIEIARRAGIKIKIAAKIDPADEEYFHNQIEHLLTLDHVEFLGEASDALKNELLGNALAVLFPINWPEPFGLVMIEAFACGTPVIAFEHGSVPEILKPGESGIICRDIAEAVSALEHIDRIDRKACRAYFEERFTSIRMAEEYCRAYDRIAQPKPRLLFFTGKLAKAVNIKDSQAPVDSVAATI